MRPRRTHYALLLLVLSLPLTRVRAGWWDPRFDLGGANGRINSLVKFHDALYAAGSFTRISGVDAPGLARWDGTNWHPVQPAFSTRVFGAAASDEFLYCTGFGGSLLRWDGTNRTMLLMPLGYRGLAESGMYLHGTNVYAEVFPDTNYICALAEWSGTNCHVVANTRSTGGGDLQGLSFVRNRIYGYGQFDLKPDGSFGWVLNPLHLAEFVGQSLLAVGGLTNANVYGIASDGENLFVEGGFATLNSQEADGFATSECGMGPIGNVSEKARCRGWIVKPRAWLFPAQMCTWRVILNMPAKSRLTRLPAGMERNGMRWATGWREMLRRWRCVKATCSLPANST